MDLKKSGRKRDRTKRSEGQLVEKENTKKTTSMERGKRESIFERAFFRLKPAKHVSGNVRVRKLGYDCETQDDSGLPLTTSFLHHTPNILHFMGRFPPTHTEPESLPLLSRSLVALCFVHGLTTSIKAGSDDTKW